MVTNNNLLTVFDFSGQIVAVVAKKVINIAIQMPRNFLILLLCFNSLISCSQTRYSIRRINGFFIVKMPGNIPVDERGNSLFKGPDTVITIYAEIAGKGPEWKTAWRNDKNYTVYTTLVSQIPFETGTKTKDGKEVLLTPAAGNKLWQLTLQLNDKKIRLPQKIKSGEVLLSGKYGGKNFFYKIDTLFQLTTPPSV